MLGISPTGKRAFFEAHGDIFTVPGRERHHDGPHQHLGVRRAHARVVARREVDRVLERQDGRVRAHDPERRRHRRRAHRHQARSGLPLQPVLVARQQEDRVHRPGDAHPVRRCRDRRRHAGGPRAAVAARPARRPADPLVVRQSMADVFARPREPSPGRIHLRHAQQRAAPGDVGLLLRREPGIRSRRQVPVPHVGKRTFNPSYSDLDNSWIYPNTTNIVAIPLRKDVPAIMAPRNDVEGGAATPAAVPPAAPGAAPAAAPAAPAAKEVNIDFDGFERRAEVLPPAPGNYGNLHASKRQGDLQPWHPHWCGPGPNAHRRVRPHRSR